MYIEWPLQQPGINGRPISFWAAARNLNERDWWTAEGAACACASMFMCEGAS
jgi:hypothetical protein